MRKKSYRRVRVSDADWNLIKSSNDIRVVIHSFCSRMNGVTEDEIEDWLALDFNPSMTPAMCKYWLSEMESYGELYYEDGLWYAGEAHGDIGRRRTESIRRTIRQLIIESLGTTGYKMIFLAGLPGGGKSTLLRQLGIEDQFTNCNIDNFFEPSLMPNLGTKNLHAMKNNFFKWHNLRKEKLAQGQELTPEEIVEYEEASRKNSLEKKLFFAAIKQFKDQISEVCGIGANFIIDGTSVNPERTLEDKAKYEEMGYDCCMIFVDIDPETSVERNIRRGETGGRSIHADIIRDMGPRMIENTSTYRTIFGNDFFLVSNRGTFEEYQEAIEEIRPGIEAFMSR